MFVMYLNDNVGIVHHKIKKIGMKGDLIFKICFYRLLQGPDPTVCLTLTPQSPNLYEAPWCGGHVTGAGSDLQKTMSPVHKGESAHSKKLFFNTRYL